jgi:hypothetical protein
MEAPMAKWLIIALPLILSAMILSSCGVPFVPLV